MEYAEWSVVALEPQHLTCFLADSVAEYSFYSGYSVVMLSTQ